MNIFQYIYYNNNNNNTQRVNREDTMIATLYICIIFIITSFLYSAKAIDCFKCISLNNDNKACDDPFHNNYTLDILESPCMGGRKGRDGLFPATSCIKMAGVFDDDGDTITVRACALDSGTLTTDTEIVRMSHCGGFYYEDRYVHGCLQSCNDADACNAAEYSNIIFTLMPLLYLTIFALFSIIS